jgi:hypothetical protein
MRFATGDPTAWGRICMFGGGGGPGPSWAQRLLAVRQFARHLQTSDAAGEIPPASLLPFRPRRAMPHLDQPQEVAALMAAAGTLPIPLQAATFRTLIGLLAVTGAVKLDETGWSWGRESHSVESRDPVRCGLPNR